MCRVSPHAYFSSAYIRKNPEHSASRLLQSRIAILTKFLGRSLTIALNDAATCFELIDDRHIKTTCAAIAQLNRVLHSAAIFDDEVRVGMTQLPLNHLYAPQGSFNIFINKLREMQVRTWALQYTMIKEAVAQDETRYTNYPQTGPKLFTTPDKDLADYLAIVHYALGLRKCCKASNKIFLKMMKVGKYLILLILRTLIEPRMQMLTGSFSRLSFSASRILTGGKIILAKCSMTFMGLNWVLEHTYWKNMDARQSHLIDVQ
jgi:hypothetical protein